MIDRETNKPIARLNVNSNGDETPQIFYGNDSKSKVNTLTLLLVQMAKQQDIPVAL